MKTCALVMLSGGLLCITLNVHPNFGSVSTMSFHESLEVMFFEGELRQSLTSAVVDARLDQGERRFTPQ